MNIDILVHGNTDFRIGSREARRRIQCPPRVSLCGVAHFDHAVSLTTAADFIMEGNI